jgi:sec-independent protein translocase protein TatA
MFINDILQPTHMLLILVVALLVLGPKQLPEAGRSIGRGLHDFRNAMSGESPTRDPVLGPEAPATAPVHEPADRAA